MFFPIDWQKFWGLFEYVPGDPLLFGSSLFLFSFFFVLVFYRLFAKSRAARIYLLILFSIFFYYKSSGLFFFILLASSLFNFYSGKFIFNAKTQSIKTLIFVVTIALNLGILGYFKYTNFILQILTDLNVGQFDPLNIFLPIGISFFTFKAMSYVIEIYLEMLEPTDSLRDFTLFVCFFANTQMGPIDRASNILPQIATERIVLSEDVGRALFLILCGLFKKFVIADYLALNFTDRVFDFPLRYTGVENHLAMYAFALQAYCDFSGYTDMAMGVALLFGYKLMDNFNKPFRANSVSDYWRRWHLSLSTWLLDFVFKPLQIKFRNMRMAGTSLAILVTFFIVGLWHGPNWTFIIFGLLHSIYLIIGLTTQKFRQNLWSKLGVSKYKFFRVIQVLFTFHLLCFTAVLFRSPSLEYTMNMFHQILNFYNAEVFRQFVVAYDEIVLLLIIGFGTHFLPKSWEAITENILIKTPMILQALILAGMIWLVIQVKSADMQPFIYFQF